MNEGHESPRAITYRVCAWCCEVVEAGADAPVLVTHGMCATCFRQRMMELPIPIPLNGPGSGSACQEAPGPPPVYQPLNR